MKAQELRIGNLVYDRFTRSISEVVSVFSPEHVKISNDYIDYQLTPIDDCKPIQLTEEWLLKFGFEKHTNECELDPEMMIEWYEIGKFCIVKWSDISPFYFSSHNMRIEIKYVNQLQNLYYALAGEELTLIQ